MRKDDVAEWLLSLSTTPERASNLAGDLMEGAEARGAFWFWCNLTRTTASLVWRSWTQYPLAIASVALRAVLLQLVLIIAAMIVILAASVAIVSVMLLLSARPELIFKPGPDDVWTTVTVWAVASLMGIVCLFLIGQWIARRSQGRELAACLAFLLFERVFWAALTILVGAGYGDTLPGWAEKAASLLLTALGIAALFAGVHRARRAVVTLQPPAAV